MQVSSSRLVSAVMKLVCCADSQCKKNHDDNCLLVGLSPTVFSAAEFWLWLLDTPPLAAGGVSFARPFYTSDDPVCQAITKTARAVKRVSCEFFVQHFHKEQISLRHLLGNVVIGWSWEIKKVRLHANWQTLIIWINKHSSRKWRMRMCKYWDWMIFLCDHCSQ